MSDKTGTSTNPSEDELIEEEVENSLSDSFPASDPPPWTLGSDHHVETEQPGEEQDSEKDQDS